MGRTQTATQSPQSQAVASWAKSCPLGDFIQLCRNLGINSNIPIRRRDEESTANAHSKLLLLFHAPPPLFNPSINNNKTQKPHFLDSLAASVLDVVCFLSNRCREWPTQGRDHNTGKGLLLASKGESIWFIVGGQIGGDSRDLPQHHRHGTI